MESNNNRRDDSQVMHSIGELTGAIKAMNDGLTRRIDDIRQDIARLERSSNDRMDHMEKGLNLRINDVTQGLRAMDESVGKRIDGLSGRVSTLESGEKVMIGKVSKLSALGGGIGGALAAGVVELLKRM